MIALAWTTPALEARQIDESGWFEPGVRAGEAFAPWLLLALALTALGFLVVLTTIARRPILNGLHPHDDELVRRIAVNRALRTAAVMAIGIGQAGFTAWAAGTSPSGQTLDQWMAGVSITLMLVLLFWRSPHVSELGSRTVPGLEGYDAGRSPRVGASPSPPGTARAVLRLRLDGATLAWILAAPTAALTGAAVLAGVQVWNGFLTSAVLDLGINDLPDGLLLTRAQLLFLLFGLLVACVIAPAPAVPGVPTRPRAERVEQGGSLR